MSYVLAALPIGWLARIRARRWSAAAAGAVLASVAWAGSISAWNIHGDLDAVARYPYNHDGLPSLPLIWQRRIAERLRPGCSSVSANTDYPWLASMMGDASLARAGGFRSVGASAVWSIPPNGALCAMFVDGAAPAIGKIEPILIPGRKRTDQQPVEVKWLRFNPEDIMPSQPLDVNLGWSLMRVDVPERAVAGEQIGVTHIWRIDTLPAEAHAGWYFAPFVKLVDAAGRSLAEVDSAPSIVGAEWRTGELIVSTVRLTVPSDAPAGAYQLRLSLFDPNLRKNAVYFDRARPGEPIIEMARPLSVMAQP